MKRWITFALFTVFVNPAFSMDSEITLATAELKKNKNIARAGDDGVSASASRVIQLQLRSSGCESVFVNPLDLRAASEHSFTVSSINCVLKEKKGKACDPGFFIVEMKANELSPDSAIVGADTYKICQKGTGNNGNSSSGAGNR